MGLKLGPDQSRDSCQMYSFSRVYLSFKPTNQAIVEAAMNEQRPADKWSSSKVELTFNPLIEFFKYYVNMNHFCVPGIDPRGKQQFLRDLPKANIPPAQQGVCTKPPNVLNQMWPRN